MIFLDTNILIYAVGAPHPLQAACQRVVQQARDGSLECNINTETIQEIMHVLTRRGQSGHANRLAQDLCNMFPQMLPVLREDMLDALALLRQNPALPARDAVHAATMRRTGIAEIMSMDPHFDRIPGIRRILPT